jgi:hypothetical protein
MEDMFPGAGRQRTGELMTGTTCLNSQPPLIPARTRRNIEESEGTVIFSLNVAGLRESKEPGVDD